MKIGPPTLLFGLALCAVPIQAAPRFILTSPDIAPNQRIAVRFIYNQMGCTGQNVAPRLFWSQPPLRTRSLAISVFDPDAPAPGGWTHWLLFGISPHIRSTQTLTSSGAIQAVTSFGSRGYSGPCPPVGDRPHRYVFTVYALDSDRLALRAMTAFTAFRNIIRGHVLSQASITTYYGR